MKNFDELLDGVLREDADAQPRAGLEGRVMARVLEEKRLPHGFILRLRLRLRLRSGWRSWLLVPAAACAGIVAVVWYMAAGGVSQPERIASRVSPPAFSAPLIKKSEIEGDSRSGLGGSVRALRDAYLRRDETAPKMGHPVLVAREAKPLPKLDVFPSPAPVDMFPRPVKASAEESQLAALQSEKVVEAIAALQREQNEPIRIAAIEIAPLQTDGDSRRDR